LRLLSRIARLFHRSTLERWSGRRSRLSCTQAPRSREAFTQVVLVSRPALL
jgi:hypothetical protein